MKLNCRIGVIAIAVVSAAASAASLAQTGSPSAAGSFAPSASLDSVLVLIDIRPVQEVRQELEGAVSDGRAAELRLDRARALQQRAAMQIDLKKSESGVLEAKLALAKSEKNQTLEAGLERQKKQAELEKALLERREEVRKKEIDLVEAEIEFASASQAALQSELELAGLRERHAALVVLPPTLELVRDEDRMNAEIRALQDSTLEARVRAFERLEKVAKQQVSVNKARRNVLAAQVKLLERAG